MAFNRRQLMKTPDLDGDKSDTSDAASDGSPVPRFQLLESKLTRLESRVASLENYKLRCERHRFEQQKKRVEYRLRHSKDNHEESPNESGRSQKRPKIEKNPDMY